MLPYSTWVVLRAGKYTYKFIFFTWLKEGLLRLNFIELL